MLLLTMLKILRGPLVNPFHRETNLGNKKGPFSRIVKTALVGERLKWRWIVPTSSRYVVLEKGKACFLTKTSL